MSASAVSGATTRETTRKKTAPAIHWDKIGGKVRSHVDAVTHKLPVQRRNEDGSEYMVRVEKREDAISLRAERMAKTLRDSGAPVGIVESAKLAALVAMDVPMVTVGGITVKASSALGRALLAAQRGTNPRGE